MRQVGLEHFEAVYDIVYYLEQCNIESRSSFCNMVLGPDNCMMCRWLDFCEKIPTENPFDEVFGKYAEHLI